MKVGGVRRLIRIVPPNLAYGSKGAGGVTTVLLSFFTGVCGFYIYMFWMGVGQETRMASF